MNTSNPSRFAALVIAAFFVFPAHAKSCAPPDDLDSPLECELQAVDDPDESAVADVIDKIGDAIRSYLWD